MIRHLQNGSMSELFLAQRAGGGDYNRRVALKRIHPYLANQPDFVHMFMDEARIASLISHPNVCPIVDFGSDHDDHYIAMDYLVGEPLAEIVEALDGLPEARRSRAFYSIIATIIADAAEGLHAAHELLDSTGAPLHVVHRDVSPGNIFVNYDGSVRIVDFGFAKARANVNETAPGMLKGTFAYMAPEQITGNANRRSDIWGLGVVLWELLSGHRLFARPGIKAILAAIQSDAIPNPRETDPE
ncbi:MAG: serine/threonine protein kinase, partial [Myxococcales bacterium]|nr:serine/threonine protein kinase [Myxococcales bacterium]